MTSIYPAGELAWWDGLLAYLPPLTYANDLIHMAMGGAAYFRPAPDLLALLIFWAIFLVAGLRLHELGRQKGL